MPVEDLLKTLREPKRAPNYILSPRSSNLPNPVLGAATGGFKVKAPVAGTENIGALLNNQIGERRATGSEFNNNYKTQEVTKLASDVLEKSAGRVPTDEWGIPNRDRPNLNLAFSRNSETINQWGKSALFAEEARSAFQEAKKLQELGSYNVIPGSMQVYDPNNLPAGTNPDNIGGRAVALAMTAFKNGTPYVWAGNSLTGGVDCSGLVQQVYRKLGIELPRSTYEQARTGKVVSLNNLLPGDLIFYDTGRNDPNGIGKLSHVAIYIGNGQVVEAYNTKQGIRTGSINYSGTPVRAIRPW